MKRILILNKRDLGEDESWAGVEAVRLSCQDDSGFHELETTIREVLNFGDGEWGDHAVAINARHQACLMRSRRALVLALAQLRPGKTDLELAAIDLREALDALGEVVGRVDTEDLLGVIFSTFCIGK